jgi:hypothetical protein
VIIGLKHQNEQFFSYIKAMKQKEIKAPIIYITDYCTHTNKHTKSPPLAL